jgi:hypothetical protein
VVCSRENFTFTFIPILVEIEQNKLYMTLRLTCALIYFEQTPLIFLFRVKNILKKLGRKIKTCVIIITSGCLRKPSWARCLFLTTEASRCLKRCVCKIQVNGQCQRHLYFRSLKMWHVWLAAQVFHKSVLETIKEKLLRSACIAQLKLLRSACIAQLKLLRSASIAQLKLCQSAMVLQTQEEFTET